MYAYIAKFGPFVLSVLLIIAFRRCRGFTRATITHFVLTTIGLFILIYGSVYELKHTPGFTLWNSQLAPFELDQPAAGASPLYIPHSDHVYWVWLTTAIVFYITLPASLFRSAGIYGRERFGNRLGVVINIGVFLLSLLFAGVGEVLASVLVVIESLAAPYSPYSVPLMLTGCALIGGVLYSERVLRKRREMVVVQA